MKIDAPRMQMQTPGFPGGPQGVMPLPSPSLPGSNPFAAIGSKYGQVAELALGVIFGSPNAVIDALARTGEGKRLVKLAGHALGQIDTAQKQLFKGNLGRVIHAFEGGSSHKQRCSKFYAAVSARIQELQTKGGSLTAQDVAAFQQAILYGDIHPAGTDADLTKIDLVAGTNPFR